MVQCLCGEILKPSTTQVDYRGRTFTEVSCLLCDNCGESYIAEKSFELLDVQIDQEKNDPIAVRNN